MDNAGLRQWRELIQPISSFKLPNTIGEARARVGHNLDYFFANYVFVLRNIVLLRLLFRHPESKILHAIVFMLRSLPYFYQELQDNFDVSVFYLYIEVFCFFMFPWDFLVSSFIGLAIVLVHAAFKVAHED